SDVAGIMSRQYLTDLENATEILLRERRTRPRRTAHVRRPVTSGSAGRAAAGALRISNTVTAAVTNRRLLGPPDADTVAVAGVVLVAVAAVVLLWPRVVAVPAAIVTAWLGVALLARGVRLWRSRRGQPRVAARDHTENPTSGDAGKG